VDPRLGLDDMEKRKSLTLHGLELRPLSQSLHRLRYLGFPKISIFWGKTPCSPLKVNGRLGGTCRFHLQSRVNKSSKNQRKGISCSFSTLKMEPTCSSETSVDFQWTAWRFIPNDRSLQPQNLSPQRSL
jgi:hypothetical protein